METSARYMQIARRWFTDGWTGDLAMADDIFSEQLHTNGVHVGVAGPVGRITERLTAFPDLSTSIEDMFVSGDKLAVTLIWRGTHTGPYGGVPATGRPVEVRDTATMAEDVAELASHLGFERFRVAGEDWGAAIAYAVAAFHRPRVQQLVFQETLLPGLPAGERDPSLAPDDGRTGWHFTFFGVPNLPELLLAGRERPFWTYFARRQMWDPSALTEADVDEMVRSVEQPGGTRAILEMYRARELDAEQNRPHYADPITCPVLAVGGEAYLGDAVSRQLASVAATVRGAVIADSGHNIALENPDALAAAYLGFFAGAAAA
jgi:pimeloyl-ACP methyl ester carboxylesterase